MDYRVLLAESDRLMMERLAQVVNDTPHFTLAAKSPDYTIFLY